MTQQTSCTGITMDKSHDTYFYTEMFVVEAGKMQNRRAQYTHVKNVPGIQMMETVSIAKCK